MSNNIKSSPLFTISERTLRGIAEQLELAREQCLSQAKEYGVFGSDSDTLVDQAQEIAGLLAQINKITGDAP
tara:strand:+ start:21577 stop:21792 length:216 start_codon:yes stop_codon:yes gene_type:complete